MQEDDNSDAQRALKQGLACAQGDGEELWSVTLAMRVEDDCNSLQIRPISQQPAEAIYEFCQTVSLSSQI